MAFSLTKWYLDVVTEAVVAASEGWTLALEERRVLSDDRLGGLLAPLELLRAVVKPIAAVQQTRWLSRGTLHPTQLYSAGWMLLVTLLLLRLWLLGAGLQFIVGSYFLLTGLGRFVEEHYRGEPQTMVWAGFRLYQWLALAFILVGGIITMVGWRAAPALSLPTGETILAVLAFGVLTYLAYGVDFPRLNSRFSRLV